MAAKRGKFKQIIDPILAKALTHKVRGAVLIAFGERGIASPKEVSDALEIELTEVSYHVRRLKAQALIRLVRTERRRGVHEHFYELTEPVLHFDDEAWRALPTAIKDRFSDSLLQTAMTDAVEALRAGTFNADDSHQSRLTMPVDERGLREVMDVMNATLERLQGIEKECAKRMALPSPEAMPLTVFMTVFENASGVR